MTHNDSLAPTMKYAHGKSRWVKGVLVAMCIVACGAGTGDNETSVSRLGVVFNGTRIIRPRLSTDGDYAPCLVGGGDAGFISGLICEHADVMPSQSEATPRLFTFWNVNRKVRVTPSTPSPTVKSEMLR